MELRQGVRSVANFMRVLNGLSGDLYKNIRQNGDDAKISLSYIYKLLYNSVLYDML